MKNTSILASATRSILKRIEDVERVVINDAVGAAGGSLGVAEERLDIANGNTAANQGTNAARVKFVELGVGDIRWRHYQLTCMIKSKREHVRAITVTKRIARIDVRRVIHAELMGESRTVPDNVVTSARPERNIVRIIVKGIRETQLNEHEQ